MTSGVIVYLARSTEQDVTELIGSLSSLKKHFLDRFPYPVIAYVEESFRPEWKHRVILKTGITPKFERVHFEIPEFLNPKDIPQYYPPGTTLHPIGYRHMCRFFSGTIYRHPSLEPYDYYWRLDTDSRLLSEIRYDLFEFMERENYRYGYCSIVMDGPVYTEQMWSVVKEYIEAQKITPSFLDDYIEDGEWNLSLYYTNFEIAALEFWRSKQFSDFFDHIDRSGGIYRYRWGDHAVHLFAVAMFMNRDEVYRFKDIGYYHYPVINLPFPQIVRSLGRLPMRFYLLIIHNFFLPPFTRPPEFPVFIKKACPSLYRIFRRIFFRATSDLKPQF